MSPTSEPSTRMGMGDYEELLSLETTVLRTLCLTVNATGSELKYKILDTLSEDDFYYPVNRAIYTALDEMHRKGDYVVYTNLEEELRNQEVDIPEDMFIEDMFRGELPDLDELVQWIKKLKERSRGAVGTGAVTDRTSGPAAPHSAPRAGVTQVRPAPEVRKAISKPQLKAPTPKPSVQPESKVPVLSSEGDEWADYLQVLASKQGKSFETGFSGLDEDAGGVSTGLMVVHDPDSDRSVGFLKQLTDQIAMRSKVPCLFVSFQTNKEALRIKTLARLSGVSAKDIERGRLKKDSPEWKRVDQNGRSAAAWLKRVFVVEADSGTSLGIVRNLARQLLGSSEEETGLVVIDSVEKLDEAAASRGQLAELKELSESLDVLVVAATVDGKLLSASGVDYSVEIADVEGGVRLEVSRGGESSTTIRLKYQPSTYKFIVQ